MKRTTIKGSSPVSSPLKQPRPGAYPDHNKGYQPASRASIVGTPVEIIQGKWSE